MNSLTITTPDDWHLHFRDSELLNETVAATERCFRRAIVMPNLTPPITNVNLAQSYRERILAASQRADFEPLMTLYLTDQTTPNDIRESVSPQIPAAKLYPAGATTNSDSGVSGIEALYEVFETMSEVGMLLLIHGEVTNAEVDIFDREHRFIDEVLSPLHQRFPKLKMVFEHITTSQAVDFVTHSSSTIAATITPQHLLLNRNDLLVGGVRPHNYCLPVLKRNTHQLALLDAVASGSDKFFLGTDSAPHLKHLKENDCGCAGCYSAWGALELYTQVFDDLDALHLLEAFASFHGPQFYGLPRNNGKVTLVRQEWQMPDLIELANGEKIVPFYAGQTLNWKLKSVDNP